MDDQKRRSGFLAKAKNAEERAAKARDADVRKDWPEIAVGYRSLAQRYGPATD